MKIRKATLKDAKAIRAMMKELYMKWHRMDEMDKIDRVWFSSPASLRLVKKRIKEGAYFIAEDKEIIGFIYGFIDIRPACRDKKLGLIDELYVTPERRGSGIGTRLTERMLAWFRLKGARWSILMTHAKDNEANMYWKNVGFKLYNMKYRMRL
ncbi:MAG: GNAT family N-acetyltransferase [Nanoarchaeota archaeon]|nr:GNAT family N-acetyltransferase [Nanoarchaeota archaeon]